MYGETLRLDSYLLMQNEVQGSAVSQCGKELNKTNLHQDHNKLKITAKNKIILQ